MRLPSIDEALDRVLERVTPLEAEEVGLEAAYGRVLAACVEAAIDLPPFPNSAMDGYAVRAADTPGILRVAGESAAGAPFGGTVAAGEAVAISTGAVMPAGADAIVPVEEVSRDGEGVEVPVAEAGAHLRVRGSDVEQGTRIMEAGTRIGPAQIGALAAIGVRAVRVHARPRVAILTTGTELRPPGSILAEGEIYDSNRPMLEAALRTAGATVAHIPAVEDTPEAHRAALVEALAHDVVISSGGVSMGEHDLVRGVAAELGVQEVFWKVALRPGKPISFGVRDRALVFGLPGNPVSTLVCFELFVRPALLALQGVADARPAYGAGVLGAATRRNPGRDDLVRARMDRGDGAPVLTPLAGGQQSHQIAIAAQADAFVRIPVGDGELPAGSPVAFLPIHRFG